MRRLLFLAALAATLALPSSAAAQCDEGPFGSHDHTWDAGLSGGVFNGHRWRIDQSAVLTGIEFEARITSGRTISWLVYEGPTEDGPWTQVFRLDTTSPGPNAYVWHTSGPIDHLLSGGTHVVLGAHIAESWGHSGGVGANPAQSWFGESISGANVDGNATPPVTTTFGHNYWTPTRIRVGAPPEDCTNGIDDDCDELIDGDDPDCEGDDDDAANDDDSATADDDDAANDDDSAAADDDDDGGRRSGCGCATQPAQPLPWWLLACVPGLALWLKRPERCRSC